MWFKNIHEFLNHFNADKSEYYDYKSKKYNTNKFLIKKETSYIWEFNFQNKSYTIKKVSGEYEFFENKKFIFKAKIWEKLEPLIIKNIPNLLNNYIRKIKIDKFLYELEK